jgi:NADPH:quinone reductase-like Zn-dependent oxidoreductase
MSQAMGGGSVMKAFVRRVYGPPEKVLELTEVEQPTPADDQVLIRVRAASVNPVDWHEITGEPYLVRIQEGWRTPAKHPVPGTDLAGVVEAVGSGVTRFKAGDEVFGMGSGTFAEYVAVREDHVVAKPANLTFEQAAAVPVAAITALQALRGSGRISAGQKVLVNGASGGVGTFAVQIAKSFGTEVTAVCSSRNVDAAKALGADEVIDYTLADFTRGGQQYDLILDIAGNRPLADRRRVLAAKGTLVMVGGPKDNRWIGPLGSLLRMLAVSALSSQRLVGMLAKNDAGDLTTLAQLLESGKVVPVVEKTYPLPELPAALTQLGGGHSQGKLVVIVGS